MVWFDVVFLFWTHILLLAKGKRVHIWIELRMLSTPRFYDFTHSLFCQFASYVRARINLGRNRRWTFIGDGVRWRRQPDVGDSDGGDVVHLPHHLVVPPAALIPRLPVETLQP